MLNNSNVHIREDIPFIRRKVSSYLNIGILDTLDFKTKNKVYNTNFISFSLQIFFALSTTYYTIIGHYMEGIVAFSFTLTLFLTYLFNSMEYFDFSKLTIALVCCIVSFNLAGTIGKFSGFHYVVLLVFCFPFVIFEIDKRMLIVLAVFNISVFIFFHYEFINQRIQLSDLVIESNRIRLIPVLFFMFIMALLNMYLMARENEKEEEILLNEKNKLELEVNEAKSIIQNSTLHENDDIAKVLKLQYNELKESESKLKILNANLKRKNKDLEHFVYIASHDLKTPMSNIEGLILTLGTLPEYQSNKEFRLLMEKVILCSENFKESIVKLTDKENYSNNEEQKQKIFFKDISSKVLSELEILISINKATVNCNFNECPHLNFFAVSLQHLLFNLITNSIKYKKHSEYPVVFIKSYRVDQNVVLRIKDNGRGMNKEKKQEINALLNNSIEITDNDGGGIVVFRKLISEGLIDIKMESAENSGTDFIITFLNA